MKRSCPAAGDGARAGEHVVVALPTEVQLGNKGGAVTLLDPGGLKVDGVAYTAADVANEGWTLVF